MSIARLGAIRESPLHPHLLASLLGNGIREKSVDMLTFLASSRIAIAAVSCSAIADLNLVTAFVWEFRRDRPSYGTGRSSFGQGCVKF